MLPRPQKAPSIRRPRPFLCIFRERRPCRPWNVRPSTRRTRFLLSSLENESKPSLKGTGRGDAYRCWRLGSWNIFAGMAERRLRLSRRTCRLPERLEKEPISSAEMRLLLRNLRRRRVGHKEAFCFSGAGRGRGDHSQVLERQSGEGVGFDLRDVVVAEVERLQGGEGPQPLGRDPAPHATCSSVGTFPRLVAERGKAARGVGGVE
ncbi:hypothetical protein EYF80_053231 [Liparis tanakae]|uniref:Uncharacterized protein n=1 Tax=Liparis tanakae TaxID=230148 RepID=A0A4Z2F5T9_9TELE|nr:hypothetical protein EYF80_053231 [Liparis tanakae]